jgi:hypothetical protein
MMVIALIFVTGDVHGAYDIRKLSSKRFKEGRTTLKKQDYVIVCGDFGLIWDNSSEDKYWLKWLADKPWTTLFLDGNHENFDLLYQYKVERWCGGNVHIINDSVIHLMRGQVFNIEGKTFLTMGGGTSIDRAYRTEGRSWWRQEIPSKDEFDEALNNLDLNHWRVDYVLTHTSSNLMMKKMGYIKENCELNNFLDKLEEELEFKHWYYGHFHRDCIVDDKHTALYNNIIKII